MGRTRILAAPQLEDPTCAYARKLATINISEFISYFVSRSFGADFFLRKLEQIATLGVRDIHSASRKMLRRARPLHAGAQRVRPDHGTGGEIPAEDRAIERGSVEDAVVMDDLFGRAGLATLRRVGDLRVRRPPRSPRQSSRKRHVAFTWIRSPTRMDAVAPTPEVGLPGDHAAIEVDRDEAVIDQWHDEQPSQYRRVDLLASRPAWLYAG